MGPTPGGATCVDDELPAAWSGGGLYNCDTYGVPYCGHTEIAMGCCYCSSPISAPSTPSPTRAGPTCVDDELPADWSAGGLYNCDTYGVAYCGHTEIAAACCYC